MTDAENDIGTALMALRRAFAKHNIPVPDVLEYSNSEKGDEASMRLRGTLSHSCFVQSQDAVAFREANVAGITIRFTGRKMAKPEGGYDLL